MADRAVLPLDQADVLKIRKFLGTTENAVRIQIAVALIAYVLLRMAHAAQNSVESLLTFSGSCAPTSCTSDRSITSIGAAAAKNLQIPTNWALRYAEPDSRGTSPRMTTSVHMA